MLGDNGRGKLKIKLKIVNVEIFESIQSKHESESDFEREEGPGEKCWG